MRPINPQDPEPSLIAEAVAHLKAGGLIILPTETVYGLACDANCPEAVEKIYEIKQRPRNKPIAYLARGHEVVREHGAEVGSVAQRLAEAFWPGPFTMVLPHKDLGPTGYRVPDHPVTLAVLEAFGAPMLATSANLSGEPDSVTAEEAERSIGERVEIILDGGKTGLEIASTVVMVSGDHCEILRQGALSEAEVLAVANHGT